MKLIRRLSLLICASALIFVFPSLSQAQFTGWDPAEQSRTHATDISHIEMRIAFDQPAKKLIGTVLHTLTVLPQRGPVDTIVFDENGLNIQKVWLEEGKGKQTSVRFDTAANKLTMRFGKPLPIGQPLTIGIQYSGSPKKGMYFMRADTFYTQKPEQIWTQGEGEDNRYWLPTYDYPNDKTTTDMLVTVRADQKALSNGKLLGKEKNKDGSVTWHWKEEKPYSTYLIMLGVGNYEVPTDMWRGKEVQYWVYPGWSAEAHRIFGLTPRMLEFFSNATGFPYAWEKYAQIAIADFQYGGMENVSATTLNDYVMFDKRSGIDFNAEGLIAHELAHQWFGDVLTCRGWLHMWLNESFATYFEALFRQFQDGQDEFEEEMQGAANAGIGAETSMGKKPIVATSNYSVNHYPRGAATLNMMRHVLGDSAWWSSIHHYLMVHQFQPVETHDLMRAIEEATGQNLTWFFDEWIFKSGHPMFDVVYAYDDGAKQAHMWVAQTQTHDSLTGIFKIPIDVELTFPDGTTRIETVRMQDSAQSFTFASPQKPVMVIFDKGNTIIKELNFHKSAEEWIYQLTHSRMAIERSQAALNLTPDNVGRSKAVFDALLHAALEDTFWAVRQHALTSLVKFADTTHDITPALLDLATGDRRADIRAQAAELIPSHIPAALGENILIGIIQHDSSYHVVGSALAALFLYDRAKAYDLALGYLKTSSPRDRMRQSAINIIEMTKSPEALAELIVLINQHDMPKFTRTNLIGSIAGMVSVDSGLVYRTLWNLTQNGDNGIRGNAINKLADIGSMMTLHELESQGMLRPEMKSTYDAALAKMRKRLGVSN